MPGGKNICKCFYFDFVPTQPTVFSLESLVNEGLPAGLREEVLLQGLGMCGCQEGREMGLNGKTTDTASLGRAARGTSPY